MKITSFLLRLSSLPALSLALAVGLQAAEPGSVVGQVEWCAPVPAADLVTKWDSILHRDLGGNYGTYSKFGVMDLVKQVFQFHASKQVPSMRFKYASQDHTGAARTYSGRVLLPNPEEGSTQPKAIPLVLYCHATETKKDFVPYNLRGDEVFLGAMFAELMDFAVAMPDQPGMGVDFEHVHPYCLGTDLAYSVLDMIPGALQVFDANKKQYKWNGKFYIMGYSEGGYTAMAAVRQLAMDKDYLTSRITDPLYKGKVELTAAACMAGPYDFSGSVQTLLKDEVTPFNRPYIPAYLIYGWQAAYLPPAPANAKAPKPRDYYNPHGDPSGDFGALNKKLLETKKDGKDKGDADEWFQGVKTGDQITELIQVRLGEKATARAVLNENWIKDNIFGRDARSPVLSHLKENNLHTVRSDGVDKPWHPTAPVLLVHPPKDECVPFSNSEVIYAAWGKQDYLPLPIYPMEIPGAPAVGHVPGAVLSIPLAFAWFKAGAPKPFADGMTGKIMEKLTENIIAKFSPDRTPKPSLIANNGKTDLKFKIIDKAYTTGNILVVDPDGNRIVSLLTKGSLTGDGDYILVHPKEKVEVYFLPTAKAVAIKVEAGTPTAASSVWVVKQMVNNYLFPATLTALTLDSKNRIKFNPAAFENTGAGYLFEMVD